MVRDIAIKPEEAKPAMRQVQVDFFAQSPLGSNPEAVSDQQHPDHQLRGDRGTSDWAIECRQLPPQFAQLYEPIDRSQKMIGRNMPLKRELIEQSNLFNLLMPNHDSVLSSRLNQ
jgi:hypothetical protein